MDKAISLERYKLEMASAAAELNRLSMEQRGEVEFHWEPGAGIGLRLEVREMDFQNPESVGAMIRSLQCVCEFFGYKLQQVGTWDRMVVSAIAEQEARSQFLGLAGLLEVPPWM